MQVQEIIRHYRLFVNEYTFRFYLFSFKNVKFTSPSLAFAEPEYERKNCVSDGASIINVDEPVALEPFVVVAKYIPY